MLLQSDFRKVDLYRGIMALLSPNRSTVQVIVQTNGGLAATWKPNRPDASRDLSYKKSVEPPLVRWREIVAS
jgi:hypothetical protein